MGKILNKLMDIFSFKLEPAEEIYEDTIYICKPGIKDLRIIDVYESDLDLFLDDGWEIYE